MRLVASGKFARKFGVQGVIGRDRRELWGGEPADLDAFLKTRIANRIAKRGARGPVTVTARYAAVAR
jgi:hypothetical protein